jgi:hypothetical protein
VQILPSEIVQAIESLIGAKSTDLYERRLNCNLLPEVNSILALLNEVPAELIDLTPHEYIELTRCRALLAAATARWVLGDVAPVRDVAGKDAVERIRRLMNQCQDQLPPPQPELPFIDDIDKRKGIEDQIRTTWTNFDTQEWLGASTFAAAAVEAVLLWALEKTGTEDPKKDLNDLYLSELIDLAAKALLIGDETATVAHMAKDARNLIHPGKVARSGFRARRPQH